MDVIKDHLYSYYISGQQGDNWGEEDAKESAHQILIAVEEFQSSPQFVRWRASD